MTHLISQSHNELAERFLAVKGVLDQHNRTHHSHAQLLAVSKTKPACDIRTLFEIGQVAFGENYLQEALGKMTQLSDLPIQWHYIGHIQRNKTKDIATHFDWVQTIERGIIAKRLHDARPENLPPLNVLIELNIDQEDSKSGCRADELPALIDEITNYDRLKLRGLMIIPSQDGSDAFLRTRRIFEKIGKSGKLADWDTLSMGMSSDMADAVAHGSTMVRVGTAIFGQRQ